MLSNISSFSFAVDDTAPQIAYSPATSTTIGLTQADLQDGWDLLFQDTGFSSFPGQLGQGASLHLTSKDGASFTLNFSGMIYTVQSLNYFLCRWQLQGRLLVHKADPTVTP